MSTFLALTRRALSYASSLYVPLEKPVREAALQAFLMAFAFAAACTALLGWCLWELDLFPEYARHDQEQAMYLFAFTGSEYIMKSFGILALFPFILAAQRGDIKTDGTISFRSQIDRLTPPMWSSFLLALGSLLLLHLLLFRPLIARTGNPPSVFGSWDLPSEDGPTLMDRYANWSLDLSGELLRFAPIVLLFLLLLSARRIPFSMRNLRRRLPALWATLAAIFVFGAVIGTIHDILHRHVFPAFVLPFQGSAFPLVLSFMSILLINTFSIPFFAACIHHPLDIVETDLPPSAPSVE